MRLTWDARRYETGIDRGVFYPTGADPQAWNGLVSVDESPSVTDGGEYFLQGVRYLGTMIREEYEATLEAFTYPSSFYPNAMMPVNRRTFSLSYRTRTATSYKIHIVYGITATLNDHSYKYDSVDPFSFKITALKQPVPLGAPSSHMIIDGDIASPTSLAAVEDALYGTASAKPYCPTPQQLYDIVEANATMTIKDNGDGTWTAIGPDSMVSMTDSTTFQIVADTAVFLDTDTYKVSTY